MNILDKLNKGNRKYCNEMISYLNDRDLSLKEKYIIYNEISNMAFDGQNKGMTMHEVFGNYKDFCDNIYNNVKRYTKRSRFVFWPLLVIFFVWIGLFAFYVMNKIVKPKDVIFSGMSITADFADLCQIYCYLAIIFIVQIHFVIKTYNKQKSTVKILACSLILDLLVFFIIALFFSFSITFPILTIMYILMGIDAFLMVFYIKILMDKKKIALRREE